MLDLDEEIFANGKDIKIRTSWANVPLAIDILEYHCSHGQILKLEA